MRRTLRSSNRLSALIAGHAILASVLAGFTAPAVESSIANSPFKPTQDSLTNFTCPQWFRDAKFGIWAHWGPQSVPMFGDWYARHLYLQSNTRGQYQHHLENFGHPSTNGWKDIIPLWKAERFDPDRLMRLYNKRRKIFRQHGRAS